MHPLQACRAFLLDMDGTLYIDDRLLPGARDLLARLVERGARRLFVTNNSSAPAQTYARRLRAMGIDVDASEVLTSGGASLAYLQHETPHRSAYVVGTPAFEDEVRASQIALEDEDPDCVLVAFDTTLTYAKLENACRLLLAGKPYYATHPDRTCITERGLVPDVAAVIGACEAVTGRKPEILGKPYGPMARAVLRLLGTTADVTAMVGDQLDTDMRMAREAGLMGVLVESDETRRQRSEGSFTGDEPPLVARNLVELAGWLA